MTLTTRISLWRVKRQRRRERLERIRKAIIVAGRSGIILVRRRDRMVRSV